MKNQPPAIATMRILWMALLSAQFIFVGMSFARPAPRGEPALENLTTLCVLACLAGLAGVASFVAPRMSYRAAVLTADEVAVEPFAPEAAGLTFDPALRSATRQRLCFVNPVAARGAAYRSAMAPFILSLALSESVGICGFLIAWLGAPYAHAAPFFVAGAALTALRFPTDAKVISAFETARGATFTR